jgi:hypothetical protein
MNPKWALSKVVPATPPPTPTFPVILKDTYIVRSVSPWDCRKF